MIDVETGRTSSTTSAPPSRCAELATMRWTSAASAVQAGLPFDTNVARSLRDPPARARERPASRVASTAPQSVASATPRSRSRLAASGVDLDVCRPTTTPALEFAGVADLLVVDDIEGLDSPAVAPAVPVPERTRPTSTTRAAHATTTATGGTRRPESRGDGVRRVRRADDRAGATLRRGGTSLDRSTVSGAGSRSGHGIGLVTSSPAESGDPTRTT